MFIKIISAVSISTGLLLGAVGVSSHPQPGAATINARLTDVRGGEYQQRIDCAYDTSCMDEAKINGDPK